MHCLACFTASELHPGMYSATLPLNPHDTVRFFFSMPQMGHLGDRTTIVSNGSKFCLHSSNTRFFYSWSMKHGYTGATPNLMVCGKEYVNSCPALVAMNRQFSTRSAVIQATRIRGTVSARISLPTWFQSYSVYSASCLVTSLASTITVLIELILDTMRRTLTQSVTLIATLVLLCQLVVISLFGCYTS